MISPNVLIIFPPGGGEGERLPNRGSYGCAVSAKARPGKISPKNLMPGQKSAQKPNDWEVFMNFRVPKTGIFHQVKVTFSLLSNITHFCQKLPKT